MASTKPSKREDREGQEDKKRYRVSGVKDLLLDGKELFPGDEFEAALPPVYEGQMLAGGHLELIEAAPKGRKKTDGDTDTDTDATTPGE